MAATLNTNGLHWKTSPAVAELEHVALGWLREWFGLPSEFFGIIYDTASVSTMHAIVCAREYVAPEMRVEGITAGLTLYTSDQAHSSVEKGAIAVGLGQKYVRKVPSDSEFRMRADVLEEMIKADIAAGLKPACVVATIGTTSTTSVDPVPAIADIAERYNMWLHVDSAYAGPTAVLPEFKHYFAGIERAHSFVTNPHKWLLTPVDLSAFYTREPKVLREAFSLVPEYLRASDDPRAIHLMDYGVALGHRFRSLKLWFLLRYFGKEGVQKILRNHIALAQEFVKWVQSDPRFELSAPAPFSTVCFRAKGSDELNHSILAEVNRDGRIFLSHTSLNGKIVLRIAIGNIRTSGQDTTLAWKLVQEAADKLVK
jgi:aromatic-L-amino-acid decarboxylase